MCLVVVRKRSAISGQRNWISPRLNPAPATTQSDICCFTHAPSASQTRRLRKGDIARTRTNSRGIAFPCRRFRALKSEQDSRVAMLARVHQSYDWKEPRPIFDLFTNLSEDVDSQARARRIGLEAPTGCAMIFSITSTSPIPTSSEKHCWTAVSAITTLHC